MLRYYQTINISIEFNPHATFVHPHQEENWYSPPHRCRQLISCKPPPLFSATQSPLRPLSSLSWCPVLLCLINTQQSLASTPLLPTFPSCSLKQALAASNTLNFPPCQTSSQSFSHTYFWHFFGLHSWCVLRMKNLYALH